MNVRWNTTMTYHVTFGPCESRIIFISYISGDHMSETSEI